MSITLYNERQKWFGWALVVLFFFCSGDAAAKEYGGAQEVTTTECLPSSLINQNVCAITGEYVISATHLVLQGPEPLTIGRTYTNHKLKSWDLNHRDAILTSSADIKDRSHKIMRVIQPSGTKLDYKCLKKTFSGREPSSFHMVVPKGLTTAASVVSGRCHLKNQRVTYDPAKEEFTIRSAAGDRSIFRKKKDSKSKKKAYNQDSMERLNGSLYRYRLSDENFFALTEISCQSKNGNIPYSKINFKTVKSGTNRFISSVIANDGRTVDYTFDIYTHRGHGAIGGIRDHWDEYEQRLLNVGGPYIIPERYHYRKKATSQYHQLSKREKTDSRFQKISYYHKGRNQVGGRVGEVTVKEDEEELLDRVKHLKAPVGKDRTPITTHRFKYNIRKITSEETGLKELDGGTTDVYDAYDHRKTYHFDGNHHLTAITHYLGNHHHSRYREECFVWGNRVGIPVELLSTKYLFDPKRDYVPYIQCFNYDDRGNTIRAALCGQLTGHPSPAIALEPNGWPAPRGHDVDIKTYAYNSRNLLTAEEGSYGRKTTYKYFNKTDNIARKTTLVNGKIVLREAFEYDQNFALTQKISDDGLRKSLGDLTGVTERHISDITPRKTYPVGLPEKIVEWVVDYLQAHQPKLMKITDYEYSQYGYLTRQRVFGSDNAHAYELTWEYDEHGNITAETNPLGQRTVRSYDSNDNLIVEIDPSGLRIDYDYDYSNRLIAKREHHSDGVMATAFEYDYLGNCIAITDPFGHRTRQEFDALNRLIAIYKPAVPNEQGQLVEPVIRKQYDIMDNVISEINPKGLETRTDYNIRHQPTHIAYPDGTYETFRYRLDGELEQKRERNGLITHYEREELGRIKEERLYSQEGVHLSTIRNTYNSLHLIGTTDPRGLETHYVYDCAGRLEKIKTGERIQQHFYDALGRVQEVREFTDPSTYLSTFKQYDLLDRLTEETLKTADGRLLSISTYDYDIRGNCIRSQKGDQVATFVYDTHDQCNEMRDALGHVTTYAYNRHFVNPYGQCVLQKTTTDPLGFQTIETYDVESRLAEISRKTPHGKLIGRQSVFYDLCGNKSRIVDTLYQEGIEQRQIETRYTYTNHHDVSSLTEAAGTPDEKTTIYHYNHLGQLAIIVKPDHIELHHHYDSFGRLQNILSSDGTLNHTFHYNLNHQIEKATDNIRHQETERHYDLYGELKEEKLAHGLRTYYDYDLLGRLTKLTLPDQSAIEYHYDGNLKEIRRLKGGKVLYTHLNTAYNTRQQLLSSQLPGRNGQITYQYDPLGRCVSITTPTFTQHIPSDGFDAAGNLLHFTRQGERIQFEYDDYYHLKSERGPVNHTYAYDSLQNRLSKDGVAAIHNALHQLQKHGNEQFSYDRSGNLQQRTSPQSTTQYTYDVLDRLIAVNTNGHTVHYTYDPFNRRLTKQCNAHIDYFLYDDQEEIGRWKDRALQELRVTSPNKHPSTIAIELNNTPYIPIHDLIGHIVLLHDLDGNIVEQYRYTAFGERDIYERDNTPLLTSSIGNPWQYSEKRFDEESGLLAFGLRYYDPKIGRWITQDPAEFEDGPNRYAYVHNNPLLFYDRYGLFAEEGSSFQENRFFQNMWSKSAGIINGVCDYGLSTISTSCYHFGAGMMEFEHDEFLQITAAFEATTQAHMQFAESSIQSFFGVDATDAIYQDYRVSTKSTLDIAPLIIAATYATGGTGGPIAARVANLAQSWYRWSYLITGILDNTRRATPFQPSLTHSTRNLDLKGLGRTTTPANSQTNIDFICGSNGTIIPTSRNVLETGFREARFPSYVTRSPGRAYILSDKLQVRVMEPSGPAPLRASFTYPYQRHGINPFTGKPPNPQRGLDKEKRLEYIRQSTHLELKP